MSLNPTHWSFKKKRKSWSLQGRGHMLAILNSPRQFGTEWTRRPAQLHFL